MIQMIQSHFELEIRALRPLKQAQALVRGLVVHSFNYNWA